MAAFYLMSIILGISFQDVVKKSFIQKTSGKGLYFFGFLSSLAAMAFFLFTADNFRWNSGLILYSALFALSYISAATFNLYAITVGPLSLTALVISYSLILPTVYGLIFLNDPINFGMICGIILLIISLFLINKKEKNSKVNLKWLIFATLAFIGNGMSSIIQKMQQTTFNGEYKNEFMILALAVVSIIFGAFVIKTERKDVKNYAKAGWHRAMISGIANGMVNLFVMILSGIMPLSVMFPLISSGGIIITYIVSKFFYKERLTKTQFIGFLIGLVSIILLS